MTIFRCFNRIILLFTFFPLLGLGQKLHFSQEQIGTPMHTVLRQLQKEHSVELSFLPSQLTAYSLKHAGSYASPSEFFKSEVEPLGFQIEKEKGVFLVRQVSSVPFQIQITDLTTGQFIPNAHIQIQKKMYCSSDSGWVRGNILSNLPVSVQLHHIAYQQLDTFVSQTKQKTISLRLTPRTIQLEPITVIGDFEKNLRMLQFRAHTKVLSAKQVTPSYGGEHIWGALKNMSGVFAVHEAPTGYLLKGDLPGQTAIDFEGIRLFELEHFLGNLSGVHSVATKELTVANQANSVSRGDFSGGILQVETQKYDPDSIHINAGVNPLMTDVFVRTPLWKDAGISWGMRRNIKNMYESGYVKQSVGYYDMVSGDYLSSDTVLSALQPSSSFFDSHLRFDQKIGRTLFKLAAYWSGDEQEFESQIDNALPRFQLNDIENTYNSGQSLNILFPESGIFAWQLKASHSKLSKEHSTTLLYSDFERVEISDFEEKHNSVEEFFVQSSVKWKANKAMHLHAGVEWNDVALAYGQSWNSIMNRTQKQHERKISVFGETNIQVLDNLKAQFGSRVSQTTADINLVFEPSASVQYTPTGWFSTYASFGKQTQFFYPILEVEGGNKSQYHWAYTEPDSLPVRTVLHSTIGLQLQRNEFSLHLQASMRTMQNSVEEVFLGENESSSSVFIKTQGVAYRYRSLEAMLCYDTKRFKSWLSYTLSKSDKATGLSTGYNELSMSDQRHELKTSQVFSSNNWNISSSFLWGSGMLLPNNQNSEFNNQSQRTKPYSRWDLAFYYQFHFSRFHCDLGASVLNVTDRSNPKFTTSIYTPSVSTKGYDFYYQIQSLPRTFALDLRVRFALPTRK